MSTRVTGGAISVLGALFVFHGQENAVEDEMPYYKCQHILNCCVS